MGRNHISSKFSCGEYECTLYRIGTSKRFSLWFPIVGYYNLPSNLAANHSSQHTASRQVSYMIPTARFHPLNPVMQTLKRYTRSLAVSLIFGDNLHSLQNCLWSPSEICPPTHVARIGRDKLNDDFCTCFLIENRCHESQGAMCGDHRASVRSLWKNVTIFLVDVLLCNGAVITNCIRNPVIL